MEAILPRHLPQKSHRQRESYSFHGFVAQSLTRANIWSFGRTAAAAETGTATATETASEVPSATPQFLNNGTVLLETFAFQGFSEQEYLGNVTEMYTEERGFNFDFGIASYVWAPQGTGCCVSYCMNATSQGMVGWGCSARKQPKSSDEFRRIFIWCGEKHSQENAICSD